MRKIAPRSRMRSEIAEAASDLVALGLMPTEEAKKMSEFGHVYSSGKGWCVDGWGVGPFVITARGKRYYFEDSDRFGPSFVDPKTGDPTNEMIPAKSPFWKAWERWKKEGRQTIDGKPLGTKSHRVKALYCVHSDLRKDEQVE